MKKRILSIVLCFTFLLGSINLLNAGNDNPSLDEGTWTLGKWDHVVQNGKRVIFLDCSQSGVIVCVS